MKEHHLKYHSGSISVSVQKVINYPFHWKKGIEIILVLEGSIFLESHKDPDVLNTYKIVKNGLHVIGDEEIHRIYSQDENNAVLLMQIEREFIGNHFAYADTLEFDYLFYTYDTIEQELLERLKNQTIYLASLVCGIKNSNDDEIINVANKLLYTLIDNFEIINRKLNREGHSRKQYERLMKITDYLQDNVTNKDLLLEISQKEYLNPDYISHLLKKYLDFNFQQLVNFYKIEKAMRMLLDSNLNISDIAYECGFSAPRYLYKHFKNYHPKGPLDFRKQYQRSFHNIDYINAYQEVEEINHYFKNTPHDEILKDNIIWIKIDANEQGIYHNCDWKKSLCLSSVKELNDAEIQNQLSLIQKEIGFQYIKLTDLFCSVMNPANNGPDCNFNRFLLKIHPILRFLTQIKIKPHIVLYNFQEDHGKNYDLIKRFLSYLENEFGKREIQDWIFELNNNSDAGDLSLIIGAYNNNIIFSNTSPEKKKDSPLFDTQYMATYLASKFIHDGSIDSIRPVDCMMDNCSNNIFSGLNGLITVNGLIKSSFHSCYLLSILGDEILQKGDCYIVTRKSNTIQIMLFNHIDIDHNLPDAYDNYYHNTYNEELIKKVNISIDNMKGYNKITCYELNNNNSVYNLWMELKEPSLLNDYDVKLLNKISAPCISFDIIEKPFENYNITLSPYSLLLINIEFIEILH